MNLFTTFLMHDDWEFGGMSKSEIKIINKDLKRIKKSTLILQKKIYLR